MNTTIKIPWAKPDIGKEEFDEIKNSFENNWFTLGPKVKLFEKQMANYCNAPYSAAVSNGTVALDIALKTIGISPGDEIIVPAMTYFSTASSVSYQNAVPVFVDIDKESYNLDPGKIVQSITNKTKAIMFIDYGGNASDQSNIFEIAKKYNLTVVQDGAQSLGGTYHGKPMGANAEISTMSFHLAKNLTCIEGGMVFTHNKNFFKQIMMRRNQGEVNNRKYEHLALGTNARMTDLQAGIGLAQFKKLPKFLKERKRVAKIYDELFKESKLDIKVPKTKHSDTTNAYFFYPILLNGRNNIAQALRSKYGIDTRIAYSMPVYDQHLYKSGQAKCRHTACPVAEEVTKKILNLPIFPSMDEKSIKTVVNAIKSEIK